MRSLKYQGGWIGAAIGAGAALLGQSRQSRADRRYQEQGFQNTKQGLILGNELDMENQKEMFNYRMDYGRSKGMTDYELFMGPTASAGGGTTGSGQTLGNAANSSAIAAAQRDKDRNTELRRDLIQAGTALQQTKMQTDAQKEVADKQIGATERGQDINKMIADNKLALDKRQLEEIAIPDLQNKTDLNDEQIKIAINEAANSDPKWVRKKTVMQLGVDNGIQNLILGKLNLDLTNPKQIQNLSDEQYNDTLTALLSAASGAGKTTAAVESIFSRIFGEVEKHDSAVEAATNTKLGKAAKAAGPHADFPGYVLGTGGPVPAGTKKYKNYSQDFPGR